jgi:preprotein translocase subunit YajC
MQEQAKTLQDSLTVGTPVMTTSGLHGTIAGLAEKTVDIEIAPGVVVTFARPAILEIRKPAEPIQDDSEGTPGERPADGSL